MEARHIPARANQNQDLARFRKRLNAGNYHALMGLGLRRTLSDAAADTSLEVEVGALRLALSRLLIEEPDPSRLAAGTARIASVAVQAARLRASTVADHSDLRQSILRGFELYEQEMLEEQLESYFPDD
jgi:hypothetical protein